MSGGNYGGLIFITICLSFIPSHFCEGLIFDKDQKDADLVCSEAVSTDLTWKLNGTDVTSKKDWAKDFSIFNNTLRLLKVDPSTVGVGNYTCSNKGDVNEIMSFYVMVRPYITQFEKPKNVIEDDPLALECKAWGVPPPVVSWWRNGTQLFSDGSKITLKKNSEPTGTAAKFPLIENATLRIEKMQYDEGGEYTCLAHSGEWVANATVNVIIKDKYAALWPFFGICIEVAVLCTIILIYEKRRAKRIEEEERQEEAAHLNANNDVKAPLAGDDVRQRK